MPSLVAIADLTHHLLLKNISSIGMIGCYIEDGKFFNKLTEEVNLSRVLPHKLKTWF